MVNEEKTLAKEEEMLEELDEIEKEEEDKTLQLQNKMFHITRSIHIIAWVLVFVGIVQLVILIIILKTLPSL